MRSIQQKLTFIIVLTSCLALLIASIAFLGFDYYKFKQTRIQELQTLAEVIGGNSAAAIDFSDSDTAMEILSMLRALPQIDRAALYSSDKHLLAKYQRNTGDSEWNPPEPSNTGPTFEKQFLGLISAINNSDRLIGYIYLHADLAAEKSRWQRYLVILAGLVIVSLGIALVVGARMQQSISTPIKTLATAATSVSQGKDYSVRIDPQGMDEFRLLINAFNDMLDKIAERENQRDHAEQELRDHRDHLEELVQQRTAALEASNKELEAFSYSVSHDLRAPLRSIHGFSQILLDDYHDKLDAQGMDYLKRVQSAAVNMANLIDDLLQLARITRSGFVCQKVNISIIAAHTIEKLKQEEPARAVKLHIQNDLVVYGDQNLLSVALDNLLGNAWKYTSKTGAAEIDFGQIHSQNGHHVFFVKDNGAGFDMKYVEKIFAAFQRLHTPDEFPGTGIGLATVQRIIDRHRGKIWAESEVGKGTTIFFTLDTNESTEDCGGK